ncbi:4a-hydroxytetrahydrobiopterin dehydratase [Kiritimatiellota bacterium B12222]|nr:4a-hydroxytetrahydrobiopterin dehydratase [Kiritimatiellota bacterium B12222]
MNTPASPLLSPDRIASEHATLPQWALSSDEKSISRSFSFKNYYHTMAFANAVAWIAHQQDHHPDMTVSYNKCTVTYSTHSAGGITAKDFTAIKAVENLITG